MTQLCPHPLTILHVVAPGEYGGLERVLGILAAGHRAKGHSVHVAMVDAGPGDHPLARTLRSARVEVHPIDVAARSYFRERSAVAALCRTVHPDVVHTHGYRADVVDAPIVRRLDLPVVTTVHGSTRVGWKDRVYEWMQYEAFRRFDAVVAVSKTLTPTLLRRGVPPGRIHLIRNASAAAGDRQAPILDRAAACRVLGVPERPFRVGWVGRLTREKGPDVLVEALRHLASHAECPAVSIIGDGAEAAACRRTAMSGGFDARITWHGALPDPSPLYRAFDVFVLSSRTEGTPMVLFEAMAAGVPIIAAAVGGVPDVLSSREALLIPPDAPAALAGAIRQVRDDPSGAACRARAGRERLARDFALDPWLARYEAVYRAVSARLTAAA